jgi:hypothetical protein
MTASTVMPSPVNDSDRQLPNATPHTLPRTSISVALLANRFRVLWVMPQVGHNGLDYRLRDARGSFPGFGLPPALAA